MWGWILFIMIGILYFAAVPLFLMCLFGAMVWAIHRFYRKAWLTFIVSVISVAALTFDIPLGIWKFEDLCDHKAGAKVHRVIPDVQGVRYGGRSCGRDCINLLKRFEYLEIEWTSYVSTRDSMKLKPGRYRLGLAQEGAPYCRQPGPWQSLFSGEQYQDQCITVEPISEYTTHYFVGPIERYEEGLKHGYGISSDEQIVLDTQRDQIVGERNLYWRQGDWSWSKLSMTLDGLEHEDCENNPGLGNAGMPLVDMVFHDAKPPNP